MRFKKRVLISHCCPSLTGIDFSLRRSREDYMALAGLLWGIPQPLHLLLLELREQC